MNTRALNARHGLLLLTATLLLAGCQQETVREIDWAKAALARNPQYEIVATDETAGVFTVRDTATGDVSTLKLNELIAAPRPPTAAPKPAANVAGQPAVESPDVPEDEGDAAQPAPHTTETVVTAPVTDGPALAEGPGYSITRGTGSEPEPAMQGTLEGPGYKIEREGSSKPPQSDATAATADAPAAANVLRRTDPIICQGERLMRIDGETISTIVLHQPHS